MLRDVLASARMLVVPRIAAGTAFLVAVLAGILSARRAPAVQPMVAMRTE